MAWPNTIASVVISTHNCGMSSDTPNIVDAALHLPDRERASLAYRLLQSLKPAEVLTEGDDAFTAELERRVESYEAGESPAADWDQVAARLEAKLRARKSP